MLDEKEVDLRYDAALAVPFPASILAADAPHVWAFCTSRGRALSCDPGALYLALHSLACFELPHVTAKYTELLDVPSVTWKLQLGKSGDGKSLVVNFVKEVLKLRRVQLQSHYEAAHKKAVEEWVKKKGNDDGAGKPLPPKVKTICDDGSAVAWCHSMSLPENESRGFVVLHECKKFMSSASNVAGAFPATTLCKLWDRDDYSHDVQAFNREFTLEKPLLIIYMAGHLEDKHKCFYNGDELGIDNRLDTFIVPPRANLSPVLFGFQWLTWMLLRSGMMTLWNNSVQLLQPAIVGGRASYPRRKQRSFAMLCRMLSWNNSRPSRAKFHCCRRHSSCRCGSGLL